MNLHPVPEQAPRAVAYIRVSQEREDMISPELQATAISDYCAQRGYELIETLEDLDLTGRFWRRRQVEHAIQMIENDQADVLVVWKVSRVSRNRKDWAVAVDRVEVAGGRLESATERLDTSTSTGRFTRGMLAELAAFESERAGEQWKEAHFRRLRAGLPHSGGARWGYSYDLNEKMHVVDPVEGPRVTETYQRYVAGESTYSLIRWLNSIGSRTTAGLLWSDTALRRVMDSGFQAGILTYKDQQYDGIHEKLVPPELWDQYKVARQARRKTPSRMARSQYLLSGLVRCVCGSPMHAGQYGEQRRAKYRCRDSKERGAHGGGGYVMAYYVEAAVINWLKDLAVSEAVDSEVKTQTSTTRTKTEVKRLAREVNEIERQLSDLSIQLVKGIVPEYAYQTAKAELETERAAFVTELSKAQEAAQAAATPPKEVARTLLDQWEELGIVERREGLKQLLDRVIVTTGRPRATFEIVSKFQR